MKAEETIKAVPIDPSALKVARALKASALFERASRGARDAVAQAAELEVLPGGAVLVSQDEPATHLAVIGRGRARVERVRAGSRVVPLGYRGGGDLLGESVLGGAALYTESAVAMEEVELVRIRASTLLELVTHDPPLCASLLAHFVKRQLQTEERIESMLFRNVEGRLAEFLLQATERWGVPTPRGTLISAPITHLEIAQAIGSTRETVTLTLGALRRDGLLDVHGRRLIVRDREALSKRCA